MKIIGLTGSIGMGKSFVAKTFEEEGVAVFDSDAEIHKLLDRDGEGVAPVVKEFPEVLAESGEIDRRILGEIVFYDKEKLKKLESILHPLVRKKGQEFVEAEEKRDSKMIIKDIPLLFETGANRTCDFVIVVKTDDETQKERVIKREGMTEEKLEAIRALQLATEEKAKQADFVIDTDCTKEEVAEQVKKIIKQVKES